MADSTLVLAQLTIDDLPPGVPASGVSIELRAAAGGDEGGEPSAAAATAALEVANHTATILGALSTPLPRRRRRRRRARRRRARLTRSRSW